MEKIKGKSLFFFITAAVIFCNYFYFKKDIQGYVPPIFVLGIVVFLLIISVISLYFNLYSQKSERTIKDRMVNGETITFYESKKQYLILLLFGMMIAFYFILFSKFYILGYCFGGIFFVSLIVLLLYPSNIISINKSGFSFSVNFFNDKKTFSWGDIVALIFDVKSMSYQNKFRSGYFYIKIKDDLLGPVDIERLKIMKYHKYVEGNVLMRIMSEFTGLTPRPSQGNDFPPVFTTRNFKIIFLVVLSIIIFAFAFRYFVTIWIS